MRRCISLALLGVVILAGCGKPTQSSSSPAASSTPKGEKSAGTQPGEDPNEAKALQLYDKWDHAHDVKLSAEDIASLPANAAESARRFGTVIDLQMLLGRDSNPDLYNKINELARKQVEAVKAEVSKQPKAVQDIFRSFLSGRGIRNPMVLDDSRVAFESDSNGYDPSDTDQNSDIYLWDWKDGSVKCQSSGEGVDGDWECREIGAALGNGTIVFERRFNGLKSAAPKDAYPGAVQVRDPSAPGPVSLTALESWTTEGNVLLPKEGDTRYFRLPAISGNGRRIAALIRFPDRENEAYQEGGNEGDQLVLLDRDTKTCRALSRKLGRLEPFAFSRDGNVIAIYAWPTLFDKGAQGDAGVFRLAVDGSPPKRIPIPEGAELNSVTPGRLAISGDGSRIVFQARAGGQPQLYLYDDANGSVTLISGTSSGVMGNGGSRMPCISADGSKVAFVSGSNNLLPNEHGGVYLYDVATHQLSDPFASPTGDRHYASGGVNEEFSHISLSADGGLLAFLTSDTKLPGVHVPKNAPVGFLPDRLFVVRLKDHEYAIVGSPLKP